MVWTLSSARRASSANIAMARTWRTSPRPLWRSLNISSPRGLKSDVSSRVFTFNSDQNHTCNPEAYYCFLYPRISSPYLLLETPMSTREMMSQDRRTTTISGLKTAGEASGAEIIIPVGRDESCLVYRFWLYILLVVTIKAPFGPGGGHLPKL